MSESALPVGWFVAAALLAVGFALIPLGLLSTPRPAEPAPSPPGPVVLALQQTDGAGNGVPWGARLPGSAVTLEVLSSKAGPVKARLSLARNNEEYQPVTSPLTALQPGNYRWRASLQGKVLVPPRAGPKSADFWVAPPPAHISLSQHQLDGSPIPPDLRSPAGAKLSAEMPFSEAVLEVEVKPLGSAFDGREISAAQAGEVRFEGADGPYHWRARLEPGPWQNFGSGAAADFIVFHPPPPPPPPSPPDEPDSSRSLSSGGSRDPLPSIVDPAPSLWSLLVSPGLLLASLGLLGAALALQIRRHGK